MLLPALTKNPWTSTDKSEMIDEKKPFSGFYHRFVPELSLEGISRDKRTGQGQKDKDKGQDIPANRMPVNVFIGRSCVK